MTDSIRSASLLKGIDFTNLLSTKIRSPSNLTYIEILVLKPIPLWPVPEVESISCFDTPFFLPTELAGTRGLKKIKKRLHFDKTM